MPLDLPDGTGLGDGIVVSRVGGYCCAVFRCKCGREQSTPMKGFNNGGVGPDVVERFGWRKIDGAWECPFCTGNTEALFKFFGISSEPVDVDEETPDEEPPNDL